MNIKGLKHKHINNSGSFTTNLEEFLRHNKNCIIEDIIVHKPYHISILYREEEHDKEINKLKEFFSKIYYE